MRNLLFAIALTFIASLSYSQTVGLKIISTGEVGIGTATPIEKLDVGGAIRIGTTTSDNAGTIRFNGNCFEAYDGTSWVSLGGSGCSGSSSGGGGSSTCEDFGDQDIARDLPLIGWRNEYGVGGSGLMGDGELCWKVDPHVGNTQQCIGLSTNPTANATLNSIDYGILLYARSTDNVYRVYIRESGTSQGLFINQTSDFDGSTFCVRRTGTLIEYVMDGAVIYTSSSASSGTLFFDNCYYDSANNPIWGVRPSSSHYKDIEICPLNTYTSQGNDIANKIYSIYDEGGYAERIASLEAEIAELRYLLQSDEPISELNVNQKFVQLKNADLPLISQNMPNPSSNNSVVKYYIPEYASTSEIVFYNVAGQEISRIEIEDKGFGELNIETSELQSALLTYCLIVDGQLIQSYKMSIVK